MTGDIRQSLDAVPFEPVTIVTSSGKHYAVPTRDHAGLNPNGSRMFIWLDDGSNVTLSILHVVAVEKGLQVPDKSNEQSSGDNA